MQLHLLLTKFPLFNFRWNEFKSCILSHHDGVFALVWLLTVDFLILDFLWLL